MNSFLLYVFSILTALCLQEQARFPRGEMGEMQVHFFYRKCKNNVSASDLHGFHFEQKHYAPKLRTKKIERNLNDLKLTVCIESTPHLVETESVQL